MPRTIDPRSYFGFGGQPLAVPSENVPLPDAIRARFKNAGQEAFIPYISPWETLSQGNNYRRAGHALDIADAENAFLDEVGSGKTGFQEFLAKHPIAEFSPMVQTYEKLHRAHRDPYEAKIAQAGSHHLDAYRRGIEMGMDPTQAFSLVSDAINKEKEAKQKHQDDQLFFVEKGGDMEDWDSLQGKSRAEMLDFIRKKGKAPTDSEVVKHSKLKSALDKAIAAVETPGPTNDDLKRGAFETVYGKALDESNQDDWKKAYTALHKQMIEPAQTAYDDFVSGLQEQGKRLPGQIHMRPAPVAAVPAIVPPTVVPAPTVAPTIEAAPGIVAPVAPAVSPFDGGAPAALAPAPAGESTAQRLLRQARQLKQAQ